MRLGTSHAAAAATAATATATDNSVRTRAFVRRSGHASPVRRAGRLCRSNAARDGERLALARGSESHTARQHMQLGSSPTTRSTRSQCPRLARHIWTLTGMLWRIEFVQLLAPPTALTASHLRKKSVRDVSALVQARGESGGHPEVAGRRPGGHGNDSSSRGAAHTHADARKPRAYSPMRHPEEALDDRLYGVSSSRHTKYQPVQCRNTKGCCQASALVAEGERMRSTRRHSKCRPAGSAARAGWIGCGATHQARP